LDGIGTLLRARLVTKARGSDAPVHRTRPRGRFPALSGRCPRLRV